MKHKTNIAIVLMIAIAATCFSGIGTIYAKNNNIIKSLSNTDTDTNRHDKLYPTPVIEQLEPDLDKQKLPPAKNSGDKEFIYDGPKSELNLYTVDKEEVKSLVEKGYSIKEIVEADAIGNLIFVEPNVMLDKKGKSKKSLEQVKNDILKERNKKENKVTSKTKKKHGIANENSDVLSEDLVVEMEKLSKKTKKSVNELAQVYKKNLKKITEDK